MLAHSLVYYFRTRKYLTGVGNFPEPAISSSHDREFPPQSRELAALTHIDVRLFLRLAQRRRPLVLTRVHVAWRREDYGREYGIGIRYVYGKTTVPKKLL